MEPVENNTSIKAQIETAVAKIRHQPTKCKGEATTVIELLTKQQKICMSGKTITFDGPLVVDDSACGLVIYDNYHTVAELDEHWIVDTSRRPRERVFNSKVEYKKTLNKMQSLMGVLEYQLTHIIPE